jgi:ATP/maltotriose-dependent transcriptional regulator MalT/DNA-binding SARP family transcriptional activator
VAPSVDQVLRRRLLDALAGARIGVVEAGGGFGKSMLAAQFGRSLGIGHAVATLEPGDDDPGRVVTRLARALRRARLSDLAAVLEQAPAPADALEALLAALALEGEPVLLVVDDAHHAGSSEAGRLLVRLARGVAEPHRLLVLGRRLPPSAGDLLLLPSVATLGGSDLAFTPDEASGLFATRGLELGAGDVASLVRATGGWAAALVLAAAQVARAADRADAVARIAAQPTALASLIGSHLREMSEDEQQALAQLAHLPLLSPEVAGVTGLPDLFERIVEVGLPLTALSDGWWELPGPVREFLAGLAPPSTDVIEAAARRYAALGEVATALTTLLAAGRADAAAALFAELGPDRIDHLDFLTLKSFVDALPDDVLERYPTALVHLARAADPAAEVRVRSEALARARRVALRTGDERLGRELDAEAARDFVRDDRPDDAEPLASSVLAGAGPEEMAARARALDVLGRVRAWGGDPESLTEAETLLEEAYDLCLALGRRTWAAQISLALSVVVHYPVGRYDRALARLDEALAALPGRDRHRAVMLSFRADILLSSGRLAEADASIAEARRLAEPLRDHRAIAYAAWQEARGASQRGEADRTARLLAEVERHLGDWFEHSTGAEFLADAADLSDRVGRTAPAAEYLERARARRDEAPLAFAWAKGALLARSGDPVDAESALAAIETEARFEPRERWRLLLLRATAALRRSDPSAGSLAAGAFEAAGALGHPGLPFVREPALAERLLAVAVDAGSAAAASLAGRDLPAAISLLGGLEVIRGGRRIDLPPGRPAQAVKAVAAAGGRMHAEELIEALWPEVDPESGRKRLRNVLNRLREAAGDLLVREEDTLALAEGTEVDAAVFEQEARRAVAGLRSAGDLGLARSALARYRGPLLPEDPYEPWAAAPRERLARLAIALVDLLARDAVAREDTDEAIRLIERAIEMEPDEEGRYVELGRLLLDQGRRGRSAAVVARARVMLEELDLPPSKELDALARDLRRR